MAEGMECFVRADLPPITGTTATTRTHLQKCCLQGPKNQTVSMARRRTSAASQQRNMDSDS